MRAPNAKVKHCHVRLTAALTALPRRRAPLGGDGEGAAASRPSTAPAKLRRSGRPAARAASIAAPSASSPLQAGGGGQASSVAAGAAASAREGGGDRRAQASSSGAACGKAGPRDSAGQSRRPRRSRRTVPRAARSTSASAARLARRRRQHGEARRRQPRPARGRRAAGARMRSKRGSKRRRGPRPRTGPPRAESRDQPGPGAGEQRAQTVRTEPRVEGRHHRRQPARRRAAGEAHRHGLGLVVEGVRGGQGIGPDFRAPRPASEGVAEAARARSSRQARGGSGLPPSAGSGSGSRQPGRLRRHGLASGRGLGPEAVVDRADDDRVAPPRARQRAASSMRAVESAPPETARTRPGRASKPRSSASSSGSAIAAPAGAAAPVGAIASASEPLRWVRAARRSSPWRRRWDICGRSPGRWRRPPPSRRERPATCRGGTCSRAHGDSPPNSSWSR